VVLHFAPLFITLLPSVGIAPPSVRVGTLVLTMFLTARSATVVATAGI
jgi:hypothetical protein